MANANLVAALTILAASALLPVLPNVRQVAGNLYVRPAEPFMNQLTGSGTEPLNEFSLRASSDDDDDDLKLLTAEFRIKFGLYTVHPLYVDPNSCIMGGPEDPGCLINAPSSTRRQPMIKFSAQSAVDIMKIEAEVSGDNRIKSVGGILRGIGGGKTRALEEMRRCMLNSNDVLPIAITFNGEWKIRSDADLWPGVDAEVSYALSITSRMASVLYGVNLIKARTIVLRSVQRFLNRSLDEAPLDAYDIIRAFVMHTVEAVNSVRGVRGPIKYVLVMVDEAMAMEEHILEQFAVKSITSTLRHALLDLEKVPIKEHVSLLISSLKVDAFGYTPFRRGIFSIDLPEYLPANEVVDSWWLRDAFGGSIEVGDSSRFALELLATTMSRNMQICEIAAAFVHTNLISNRGERQEMLNFIRSHISKRYAEFPVPPSLLYSIVYGCEVSLIDEGVADALQRSIISNSAPLKTLKGGLFLPQSSLMALSTLVGKFDVGRAAMEAIFEDIINFRKARDVFESFLRHWLKVRLYVASSLPVKKLSLSSLLGMEAGNSRYIEPKLLKLLDAPLAIGLPEDFYECVLSSNGHDAGGQIVADKLMDIEVSARSPVALVIPGPEESFDMALKFFRGNEEPLYVLLDCKSAMESDPPGTQKGRRFKFSANEGEQSAYCPHNFIGPGKIPPDDLVFVFMMNHEGTPTGRDGVAYFGRNSTQKFLGPLWEIYLALRANMPKQMPPLGSTSLG